MAKKYYWLKMKDDFFRQKEIKKIRKIAGGDTYTIIYLKLMLLSLRNEGRLFFDGIEESIAEELALEIDEDSTNVQTVLGLLITMHIIEEISEGVEIANIKQYIGSETAGAERTGCRSQRGEQRYRHKGQCDSFQPPGGEGRRERQPLCEQGITERGGTCSQPSGTDSHIRGCPSGGSRTLDRQCNRGSQ